jgi:hypothetical protein
MTRQAIIAVVIGVIIILGAAAAILYSRIDQSSQEANVTATEQSTEENEMTMGSIVELFSKGENAKCTFNTSTQDGEVSGTFYISEDKARGTFETSFENENLTTNIIRDGDVFYTWGDTFDSGIRMEMPVEEWADNYSQTQEDNAAFNPNEQINIKCVSWTVDSTLFTPPADIDFISFDGFLNRPATSSGSVDSPSVSENLRDQDQCSICSALSGEARTVCLQQLNCQ